MHTELVPANPNKDINSVLTPAVRGTEKEKKYFVSRFEQYQRRAAAGDQQALSLMLAQEVLNLAVKYNHKGLQRQLQRAARSIRVYGKRKPEADQLAVMLAIREGCREVEEICEMTNFERDEVKDILAALVESKKVVEERVHRVHSGKGAKRRLYFLAAEAAIRAAKQKREKLEKEFD